MGTPLQRAGKSSTLRCAMSRCSAQFLAMHARSQHPSRHHDSTDTTTIAHLPNMAASVSRYVELAKQLHPRLQRFLAKYPPSQILPKTTATNTIMGGATPNPFLPHKHPITGKWHDPEYSLRRQAELVKLAREEGVEELLPFTSKGTEERIRHRVELGLRVRGTGIGQRVKGHRHERMLAPKYVASLMLNSPRILVLQVLCAERILTTMPNPEWKRGERLCWACRDSSGNGGR